MPSGLLLLGRASLVGDPALRTSGSRVETPIQTELGRGLAVGSFHACAREGGLAALRIVRIALEHVLIHGWVLHEAAGLADLGHGLAEPVARGIDVRDRLFGHPALLLARI